MARNDVPEKWVGKRVGVQIIGSSQPPVRGQLRQVNDRGILLHGTPTYSAAGEPRVELSPKLLFYPWGAVAFVQYDDEEPPEEPGEETSTRFRARGVGRRGGGS